MRKILYFSLIVILFLAALPTLLNAQTYQQKGEASYYADKFHGRKTASGEIYNKADFTAAHRTLPFGTKIKVINLENGKSVIVRINDRGPFKHGRIIDLSRAAAEKIDLIRLGVTQVEITTDENMPPSNTITNGFYDEDRKKANPRGYGIQAGSFKEETNAFEMAKQASKKHSDVFVWVCESKKGKSFKVLLTAYQNKKDAEKAKKSIKKQYKGAFIVDYKRLHCK